MVCTRAAQLHQVPSFALGVCRWDEQVLDREMQRCRCGGRCSWWVSHIYRHPSVCLSACVCVCVCVWVWMQGVAMPTSRQGFPMQYKASPLGSCGELLIMLCVCLNRRSVQHERLHVVLRDITAGSLDDLIADVQVGRFPENQRHTGALTWPGPPLS